MKRWVLVVVSATVLLVYCSNILIGLLFLREDTELKDPDLWGETDRPPSHTNIPVIPKFPKETRRASCKFKPLGAGDVLVVGALRFVGARLTSHLISRGRKVRAVSSYQDTLRKDDLVWYRQEQLFIHHGVVVMVANLTNETQVERTILSFPGRETPPSEVIFVPPGIDMEESTIDAVIMTKSLVECVTFLEILKMVLPCTRVLLLSHSRSDNALMRVWMQTFEITLSTYHNIYGMPIMIFKLSGSGVYGAWGRSALNMLEANTSISSVRQWMYVEDVAASVYLAMQHEADYIKINDWTSQNATVMTMKGDGVSSHESRGHGVSNKVKRTLKWAASYVRERDFPSTNDMNIVKERGFPSTNDINVVFTSYFTSIEDTQRQRQRAPSRFQYMADFYQSLKKLEMSAVIFHDGLDTGFQSRVSSQYHGVSFAKVDLHNRSTNDARFYAYYDYLREHSEIKRVLLSDISDVVYQKDPFHLMSLLGDWLYVGTDIDIFPNLRMMPWIQRKLKECFGNYSVDIAEQDGLMDMDTVYNAGTMGGTRETVLAALSVIVTYLDITPWNLNCNMPAFNFALHRHFFKDVFTGFPLNSRFFRRQSSPKGVYIIHK